MPGDDDYDEDEDAIFEDDEEGDELPVIPAPGAEPHPADVEAARPRPAGAPHGNTKSGQLREARLATTREAQGRALREPEQWREDLAAGDRGKAIAALTNRKSTHNAGSGFGLAGRGRYD